jgi:hypothetical protein
MRGRTILASLLVIALIAGAVFGLYVMVGGHFTHEAGCTFMPASLALCAMPFAHLKDWQAVYSAIFAQVVMLLSLVAVCARGRLLGPLREKLRQSFAFAVLFRAPQRPSLFQELYSDGILNRKEAYGF